MTDVRIVSLVPSITELLCDLGLGAQVVGRTGFCIHPSETVRRIPKVGGTKDLRMERIRELAPTHVVVNVDENRREDFEELSTFVPRVVVTHPLGPSDNLALYRQLGDVFDREVEAEALCAVFERAYAELAAGGPWPAERVLYLIWREPWMTVSADTYIARTLELVGWETVAGAPVDAAGAGADRYPEVRLEELAGRVDRVLLSSEPYHFNEQHFAEIRELLPGVPVSLIDGEMTSWYGSRAIRGLEYLGQYRRDAPGARPG